MRSNRFLAFGRDRIAVRTIIGCAAWLLSTQAGWAQSWNLYSGYSQSYTVPYINSFTQSVGPGNGALDLNIKLGNSAPVAFEMDTGSTGMAVSSQFIPNFSEAGPQGWVFYNSSGLLLQGYFNTIQITFVGAKDANGTPVTATATVPVLGVTNETCLPGFPNGCSAQGPVFMFGVGVDRNTMGLGIPSTDPMVLNAAPPIAQSYNPLVNLNAMNSGVLQRGFIISSKGLELGLTAQNTSGFAYQQLLPLSGTVSGQNVTAIGNWTQASMAVSVNSASYVPGTALMDTGVNDSFLHVPGSPTGGPVQTGTQISVQLLNANGNVGYSFTVGSNDPQAANYNPQTPNSVNWSGGDATASFLNTSLKLYSGFDYLYDATDGFVGLATNDALPGTNAFVIPVLSAAGTLTLGQNTTISMPVFISDASTVSTSATATFNQGITGPGSFTVAGTGSVVLNAANTYGGGTNVQQGTLVLNGSLIGAVAVGSAGIFDISGTSSGASITSLTGAGLVNLGGQQLTLSNAGGTFSGTIADGGVNGGSFGSLTIAGGNQTLSGRNAYTGATIVNSGATLALSGSGSIASSSGVTTNGTFDISGASSGATIASLAGAGAVMLGSQTLTLSNASGSFGGVIADGGANAGSGGSLSVAGGTQTLSGANTYTGATAINSGATLALAGSGSVAASSGVTANGTLDISRTSAGTTVNALAGGGAVNLGAQTLTIRNASGTFSGSIGGSGGLSVTGGMQTLTGASSYTGGTQISGGAVLAIASDSALGATSGGIGLNNGMLLALSSFASGRGITLGSGGGVIDAGSYTVTLSGPISGSSSLTSIGNVFAIGPMQLSGIDAINGGISSINGTLNAAGVLVAQTGTLRGIGTINAPVQVSGRIAPGNSPGTLTVTAPVVLNSGSVSQFDIDGTGTGTGAGNYSRLIVTGAGSSITLNGTLLPLLRGITGSATNTYTPPLGQQFQIISAQGGVLGSYAGLTQPSGLAAGTRFDALYGPTSLTLTVTPAMYGNLALAGLTETANQAAVGSALDAQRPAAGVAMTAAQAAVYDPLYALPNGADIAPTLEQLAPTIYGDALMAQRDGWYLISGAIGEQLDVRRGLQGSGSAQVAPDGNGRTIWLAGLGQFGNVASNGTSGYNDTLGGTAVGIDMAFTPEIMGGFAFGFANESVGAKNAASFSGDAFQFMLYGSWNRGIAFLDAQGGGVFTEGTATRPQYAYGTQASGNTNGSGGGGLLRAGVRLDAGNWRFEPNVTLAGVALNQGGVTETLGGAAAQSIGSSSIGSLQTVAGVRVERRFVISDSMAVVPSAQLGWLHEYLDTEGTTTASLLSAPGASFTVQSAPIGRNAAVVGLRAVLETKSPLSLFASYTGTLNSSSTAQTVAAGLRYVW